MPKLTAKQRQLWQDIVTDAEAGFDDEDADAIRAVAARLEYLEKLVEEAQGDNTVYY